MNHRYIRNVALAACASLSVPLHAASSSESSSYTSPTSASTASAHPSDASPWEGLEAERAGAVAASGTDLRSLLGGLAEDTGATFRFATPGIEQALSEAELRLSDDYVIDADRRWTFVEGVLADNGYFITVADPAGTSIFTVHQLSAKGPLFTNLTPLEVSPDDRALLEQHPATFGSMLVDTGKASTRDVANWLRALAIGHDRMVVVPVDEHRLLLRGCGAPVAECARLLGNLGALGPDAPDPSMSVVARSASDRAAGEARMRLAATGGKDANDLSFELRYLLGESLRMAPVGGEQVLLQGSEGDLDLASKLIELASSEPTETVELALGGPRLSYLYTGSVDATALVNALRITLDEGGESARLLPSGDRHIWLRGAEAWTAKVRALVESIRAPGAPRGR